MYKVETEKLILKNSPIENCQLRKKEELFFVLLGQLRNLKGNVRIKMEWLWLKYLLHFFNFF